MTGQVRVLLGTNKGALFLESDGSRRDWQVRGPFCDTWPINHVIGDQDTGAIWACGGSQWHGLDVWRSRDGGDTWTRSAQGLTYGEDAEEPVQAVWSLAKGADGALYAGVKPAGLFVSRDDGETWTHLNGLRDHPTRDRWMPGGAGLILHTIVPHPTDPKKLWVGISTAGVFAT